MKNDFRASFPIRWYERVLFAATIYLLFFGCYSYVNKIIPLEVCRDLSLSFDALFPFRAGFIYPFYLTYILILLPAFLVHNRNLLYRSALAFAFLIIISCIIFIIYPVYVPRPFIIPGSKEEFLIKLMYSHDLPVCGFPSLHVSSALLATLILLREYRLWGVIFLVFTILTACATLFVKQHVVLDVAGGVLIALVVDWLLLRGKILNTAKKIQAAILLFRLVNTKPVSQFSWHESRRTVKTDVEYDLYEPSGPVRGTWVLVHGVTLQGERDHRLVNFARALARSQIRVAAVAVPGLKSLRFDSTDLTVLQDLIKKLYLTYKEPVGVMGFSLGGGYALTAACQECMRNMIDLLILFGPHYNLSDVWTGLRTRASKEPQSHDHNEWDAYLWANMSMAYRSRDFLPISSGEKDELVRQMENYCINDSLQNKREFYERVLKNQNINFMEQQLSDKAYFESLSPAGRLSSISTRVCLLHDKNDQLVLPEQSRLIFQELSEKNNVSGHKILITTLLSHVSTGSGRRLMDLFRFLEIFGEIFH